MRLFLAIDPGEDCRQRLAGVIAAIRASAGGGIRWVRDGQLHVTLAFLGEVVDESRITAVDRAMREVAHRHVAFGASVSGRGGVFPDWRRPSVVWLGLDDGGALRALGEDVGRACAASGFPPDRAFRAHLTIGRIPRPLRPGDRDALRVALETMTGSHPFPVDRVRLMRSELTASGSRYSEVASYPLEPA